MMQRAFFLIGLLLLAFLLGGCQEIENLSQTADFSQIESAEFYGQLQGTIALVQIPVIIVGLMSLVVGWKMGRLGLALNGGVIGGLMLYTYLQNSSFLQDNGWVFSADWLMGIAITGSVIIGILTYFLYNIMALIIGGVIGSTLMNGAWLQIADNVPPQILVFVTTFVSALVMFLVFRLFLVAFSAVIGAAILMLAFPYPTLWVIPVAITGIVIQMIMALLLHDDIFKNLRGDFGAALGQAFGEVLGPIGTLRDYQKSKSEAAAPAPRQAAPEPKAKPVQQQPSYQQPYQAPQQPYQAPQQGYQQPYQPQQPYQAPKPATPPQQQPYQPQQPYQAPQQGYQAPQPYQAPKPATPQTPQQPYQAPQQQPVQPSYPAPQPAKTEINPAAPAFRPENYQIMLSTGQSFPLLGTSVTVGRNADNTIVLNDSQVSGYHLMLSIQAEGVVVWDNNSTNGTLFNGMILTGAVRLTVNDVLQVGGVSLRLVRVDFQ